MELALLRDLIYSPGLDRVREPVISSHFMNRLMDDERLRLYDTASFESKVIDIEPEQVTRRLVPAMVGASDAFAVRRAAAAKQRARENYLRYGLGSREEVKTKHFITEVLFDRQFRRAPVETCSRVQLCERVSSALKDGRPLDMVVPALPFKFPCPLKVRGRAPDLAELNFMLELYEIAAAVTCLYAEIAHHSEARARFTVVSDGSRFSTLANVPESFVESYQDRLRLLARIAHVDGWIGVVDYRHLLREHLPEELVQMKTTNVLRTLEQYENVLWPVFDPLDMDRALQRAAELDPDPEISSRYGRFVSLLKSLIYTVDYRALQAHRGTSVDGYQNLYHELTRHLFKPYPMPSLTDKLACSAEEGGDARLGPRSLEALRQSMLREVWQAAIGYMAEIKGDRELVADPIATCLPDHLRWTIHPKAGQLGLLTTSALGYSAQAWASSPVFLASRGGGVRLANLPALMLEGTGATPVRVRDTEGAYPAATQPLFYVDRGIKFKDMDDLLSLVEATLTRRRSG